MESLGQNPILPLVVPETNLISLVIGSLHLQNYPWPTESHSPLSLARILLPPFSLVRAPSFTLEPPGQILF